MSKTPADCVYEVPFAVTAGARAEEKTSGCEDEVMHLFVLYRNPLLRYVISLGLSQHDGEEIIQEVFMALFRHLRLRKPRQNLRGWLFRVAHNLALKQRIANQKTKALLDPDETLTERQPDATPNPEQQASSRQRWQRVQAVLRVLPEQDRYCLYLRAEGLRYREIAAALGISLGAVSLALTRSLARIKPVDER